MRSRRSTPTQPCRRIPYLYEEVRRQFVGRIRVTYAQQDQYEDCWGHAPRKSSLTCIVNLGSNSQSILDHQCEASFVLTSNCSSPSKLMYSKLDARAGIAAWLRPQRGANLGRGPKA